MDVRVGDDVLLDGQWRRVAAVKMQSEYLMGDEEAASHAGRKDGVMGGWLVKAPEGYVSPLSGGSVRRVSPTPAPSQSPLPPA